MNHRWLEAINAIKSIWSNTSCELPMFGWWWWWWWWWWWCWWWWQGRWGDYDCDDEEWQVRLNPGAWWRTSRVLFLYKWLSNVVKYLQLIVFAVCFTAKNQYRTSFHFIQTSKDGSDHNCWLTLDTIQFNVCVWTLIWLQFNVCCPHTS